MSSRRKLKSEILDTKRKLQKARNGDSRINVGRQQEKLGELAEEWEEETGSVRTPSLEEDSNEMGLTLGSGQNNKDEEDLLGGGLF